MDKEVECKQNLWYNKHLELRFYYLFVILFSIITDCRSSRGVPRIITPYIGKGLKAVDTIGNCQRLAFTVSVSQHNA